MTLSDRDKRLLILVAAMWLIGGAYFLFRPSSPGPAQVVGATDSITAAEQRLQKMRLSVARVPGQQERLAQARAMIAGREKGMIIAPTAAQAQEQVLQIVRQIARKQAPPVEIQRYDLGLTPRTLGDSYGEVAVAVHAECSIDQLVNMLADLSARPELVATEGLTIASANPKQKTMNIRFAVAGVVPRSLIPDRRGPAF